MTCHLHPSPEILLRYASGNLSPAYAIAVELHTQFCSGCEASVIEFEALGGHTLNRQRNTSLQNSFDQLLEKLNSGASDSYDDQASGLPKVLDEIMSYSKNKPDYSLWKKLSANISSKSIDIDDPIYASNLLKINTGARVPKHTHKGQEITVVVRGSFKDEYGKYTAGDFLVRNESHQHAPSSIVDCVCFSVTDAPLNYKGFFGPLINLIAAKVPRYSL